MTKEEGPETEEEVIEDPEAALGTEEETTSTEIGVAASPEIEDQVGTGLQTAGVTSEEPLYPSKRGTEEEGEIQLLDQVCHQSLK